MSGRDELDPRVTRSLEELRRDVPPSPGLESRVLKQLRSERLVRRRARLGPTLARAAVLAAVFAAGIVLGDRRPAPTDRTEGGRYVLLLIEGPSYRTPATPEAERKRVAEYAAWARGLAERGRFVEGEKLGHLLHRLGEPAETAEGGEAVAGFFVIGAESREEAIRIARTTPHLRYGGSVEVRPIETTE
jgi:hypothetical protein